MRARRLLVSCGFALSLAGGAGAAANVGHGFGESLWALMSAGKAGTGGLVLEDPWRQDLVYEASTILLDSGLQWFEVGYQGGVTPAFRAGAEVFMFTAPGIEETIELEDGSYGGKGGEYDAREYGGRVVGQFTVADIQGWRMAAIGRVSGVLQELPGDSYGGMGVEIGLQSQLRTDDTKAFTVWCWLGPYGRGAGLNFTRQGTVGGSLVLTQPGAVGGYGMGYGLGGEARFLGENLFHSSVGAAVWLGSSSKPGTTFFCRVGIKEADESALFWQPHAGMGVLWKRRSGTGIQLDYAVAPRGDLGNCHYATLSVHPGERVQPR